MLPKSRRLRRGAYRNVVPNEINGIIKDDLFGSSKGNSVETRLVDVSIGEFGDFNNLNIYKRKVSTLDPSRIFSADVNLSAGDINSGQIKLMSPVPEDISVNISIGENNNLEMKTYDSDDITIGNDNTIIGKLDTKSGGVAIGDNNFLVDFKTELTKGSYVKGFPKSGSLTFSTQVSEYAGMGQNYIQVENTDRISSGMEIIFGSTAAGFVRRDVTGVTGDKVYFDTPLESRESTVQNSLAFNEYYEILPAYSSTLSRDVERRSKRIFVTDNQNLHLRKVSIGGSFDTIVFFMREEDNMTIIKDMTPDDLLAGTTITSQEVNPYSAWIPSLVQDDDIQETYIVSGPNKAFIGRSVFLDGTDYTIIGFTEDTITFDQALPLGTESLYFGELDSSPSGEMVTSNILDNVVGNTLSLTVEDSSKFFAGQSINIEGMSTNGIIRTISGDTLFLEEQLFDDVVNGKFYVGSYELPKNKNSAMSSIDTASGDLHNYIFGVEA